MGWTSPWGRAVNSARMPVSAVAIVALVFLLASCALQFKKAAVQKPDSYRFTLQDRGFTVSADPYKEDSRLDEYFGCDLLSRGILPVLLVIENQMAGDGFNLLAEEVRLLMKGVDPATSTLATNAGGVPTDELHKAQRSGALALPAAGEAVMYLDPIAPLLQVANLVQVAPLVQLAPIAVGFVLVIAGIPAQKRLQNELQIRRNLEEKQLLSKTLYPGGTQAGFLYFKLNNKEDLQEVQGINLTLKNVRSNEVLSFSVRISED